MKSSPLILTPELRAAFGRLKELAGNHPVDVSTLLQRLQTPEGEAAHRAQMTAQSMLIPGPWPFLVTFSFEYGHPAGLCRHMSLSIERKGRVPSEAATWMVAEEFGFGGALSMCKVWPERLRGHGMAVNVVQPVSWRRWVP